jgi:hypothetical protein
MMPTSRHALVHEPLGTDEHRRRATTIAMLRRSIMAVTRRRVEVRRRRRARARDDDGGTPRATRSNDRFDARESANAAREDARW